MLQHFLQLNSVCLRTSPCIIKTKTKKTNSLCNRMCLCECVYNYTAKLAIRIVVFVLVFRFRTVSRLVKQFYCKNFLVFFFSFGMCIRLIKNVTILYEPFEFDWMLAVHKSQSTLLALKKDKPTLPPKLNGCSRKNSSLPPLHPEQPKINRLQYVCVCV